MKNLFIVFFSATFMLLSACQSTSNIKHNTSSATTKIYRSHCLTQATNSNQQMKLGYGSGLSLSQAKQHAYKDIAEQFGVEVKTQSLTRVTKKQTEVIQTFENKIETFAETKLDDLSIECLDKQDPSGKVHVLLGYDLRPLHARIADKLIDALGYVPGQVTFNSSEFLSKSQLALDVKRTLLAHNGSKPLNAEIKLRRHKNKWQWLIARQPFYLSNNQLHLAINWQTLNKGAITLSAVSTKGKTLPPAIKAETEFRLRISTKQKGYLQLLGIYENGEVAIIRHDIKTMPSQQHTFPEKGGIFEAGLLEANKAATDIYLAIVTQQRLSKTGLLTPEGLSSQNEFYLMQFLRASHDGSNSTKVNSITILPHN